MLQSFIDHVFLFFDSSSRLFYVSVLGSLGLLAGYYCYKDGRGAFQIIRNRIFNRTYWWNGSTKVDYQIFIINAGIKALFFGPLLGLTYFFSVHTMKLLNMTMGSLGYLQSHIGFFVLATLFGFVLDDFLRFLHHYLMHKIPFLWELHKTHHSAKVLTPFTLYRIHPLESAIATIRNSLSYGVATGAMMYLFAGRVELLTLFGVNAFGFLLNVVSGNLRHSHIPISFGYLEYLFISPKQHQLHHSVDPHHFDKNFGVNLAIWDWLFGSYLLSANQTIRGFGVHGSKAASLKGQFIPSHWIPKPRPWAVSKAEEPANLV